MNRTRLHLWTIEPDEAIRIQEELLKYLVLSWDDRAVKTLAGIDYQDGGATVTAAIAVFSHPGLQLLECSTALTPVVFPYLPGLLAFRVGPAMLRAWEKLESKPDLVMIHGHGISHPRRMGLASHLGLWMETPTIGIARSLLYGSLGIIEAQEGNRSMLTIVQISDEVTGAGLRTRANSTPVFVSPGHLIDIDHSIDFVLACCRGYRMPEPLRAAHKLARNLTP
jgi:deoxyribonuclease V